MMTKRLLPVLLIACAIPIFLLPSCGSHTSKAQRLDPAPNSHIVFIGNTFAERLQHFNYFETLIQKSFPDRNLTIRNLGWSADEVALQPRPLNFGSLDQHLTDQKADIIFACFGMNEAFKGPDSVSVFRRELSAFLNHLQAQHYNGQTAPQIVLVSPIAHEQLGGFLPDAAEHNRNLETYTGSMRSVADSLHLRFIDLYQPTQQLEAGKDSITINGIHLSDDGYRKVGDLMADALGLPFSKYEATQPMERLRSVIDHKNQQYFYLFRAVNGEYIYGRRKEPWVQPAGGPISFPSELKKLDHMVVRLDSVVWAESRTDAAVNLSAVQKIIVDTIQFKPFVKESKNERPSPDQFVLASGYEINLFASEVDFPIGNPVKITFDPKGRLWVADMPSYPQYLPGAPPNDKIIVLEDTDHDGRADRHTVFADSLYMPLGFELGYGGVYVTQAPDLVLLKDNDGDGKADEKKSILHGFGTEDIHHAVNAQTWGQDGALYWHTGTFLHNQVETPYGPTREAYGSTWRFEPRTLKLETYVTYPYANPWGNVFMRDGTHIIGDVSTGMNYFAPPLAVASDYPKKHTGMKDFLTNAIKPKTCGTEVVSSRQFPDNAQGNVLFNTFIGFLGVRQHQVTEDGSGITGHETEPLLQSKDPNFRPVDLQFGPDGALYVVDWYNPIINHGERALRDSLRDHTHGRIWRVSYKGRKIFNPIDLTALPVDQLLDQLKAYEDRQRYRTRMQLSEMPEKTVLPALEKWVAGLDKKDKNFEQNRLEGLWVYQQFNRPNEKLLNDVLRSPDHHARAAATRVLFYWKDRVASAEQKLIAMSTDHSPRVRLEAIVSLSHFNDDASVNALLAATEQPVDYYLDYALKESFKQLEPVWMTMFKKDHSFLSNDSLKARYLLEPLSSAAALDVPGFIKDDPQWSLYARSPLSQEDFEALKEVTAVKNFLKNRAGVLDDKSLPTDKNLIHLATVPAKMLFDQTVITVTAGAPVTIIFDNVDGMPHNVVITKPGSAEKVGKAAEAMASRKDGYEKSFVPNIPEVLFSTPLVNSGKNYRLVFKAPAKPGDYPFICSFPGHWQTMKGVMRVVRR